MPSVFMPVNGGDAWESVAETTVLGLKSIVSSTA